MNGIKIGGRAAGHKTEHEPVEEADQTEVEPTDDEQQD